MTLAGVRVDGAWSRDHPSLSHLLWLWPGRPITGSFMWVFMLSFQRASLRISDNHLFNAYFVTDDPREPVSHRNGRHSPGKDCAVSESR